MRNFILCAAVLMASVAHADEPAEPPPPDPVPEKTPHLAMSGTLGIATPLGFAGLELEAHLTKWLSLSAGVGLAGSGVQVATMARGSLPIGDKTKLYAGLGLSGGRWVWNEFTFDEPAHKTWDRAYWVNGEVGLWRQFIWPEWSGRVLLGYSRILNRDDYVCGGDDITHCMVAHAHDGESLIYVGYSVARSFQ